MEPDRAVTLSLAITRRTARLAVLGLGYAGLPLAEAFVRAGFAVAGLDVDAERIAHLRQGASYLRHISPERIHYLLNTGRFQPSGDFDALASCDAALICVPTPLTAGREPDLSAVRSAAEAVARRLRPGQLVVLESTTYPGTTRGVLLPILETSGWRCGQDYFLAYSPEREDPGNREYTTARIPRVVGGIDGVSGRLAAELYATAVAEVVPVSSAESAEACKMLENTYRAVNIALVNELKVLYSRMGIDIWEVIEAAKTKPFGFQAFYPGPGWGGHCIPLDPFYLAWVGRQVGVPMRFVELAGEINTAMPRHVLERTAEALAQEGRSLPGSRVGLLGMAYKRDVDDARESPGLELLRLLSEMGAQVSYHDPYIPRLSGPTGVLTSQPLSAAWLVEQDAVLIVTDHSVFDWSWIAAHARLLVDTRNATRGVTAARGRIIQA
jgi:UDP-N-acetyl-D-glucosamine dehydrogenase